MAHPRTLLARGRESKMAARIEAALERFIPKTTVAAPAPMPERRKKPGPAAGSPERIEGGWKSAARRLGIPVEEYRRHREDGQRWCYFHKTWEPPTEFGPCQSNPDGLARQCRAGVRERRATGAR